MPRCSGCKKVKPKNRMLSTETCNQCYLNIFLASKPNVVTSKCKHCGIEYKSTFNNDNNYCTDHYYIEEQEEAVCKKCSGCSAFFCTRLNRTRCDTCLNK